MIRKDLPSSVHCIRIHANPRTPIQQCITQRVLEEKQVQVASTADDFAGQLPL